MTRPRRRVLAALLIVLGVALAIPLTGQLVTWLASRGRVHSTVDQTPTRAVLVVLGAGLEPNGRPSPFLQARLQVALDLYRRGGVSTILVSGDGREANYDEPKAMRRWLIEHQVPEQVIVQDTGGLSTYATCVRTKRDYGFSQITLVTQSYHIARAVATCRLVGLDAIGVGDDTVKIYTSTWNYGVQREWASRVKMLYDVVVRPSV